MTIGTMFSKITDILGINPDPCDREINSLTDTHDTYLPDTGTSPDYTITKIPMPSYYTFKNHFIIPLANVKVSNKDDSKKAEIAEAYLARRNNELRWQGVALTWVTKFAAIDGFVRERRALNNSRNWESISMQEWGSDLNGRYELFDLVTTIRELSFLLDISFHDAYVGALLAEKKIGGAYLRKHLPQQPMSEEECLLQVRQMKQAQRRAYRAAAKSRSKSRRKDRRSKRFATRKFYTQQCAGSLDCHAALDENAAGFCYS